MDKKAKLLCVIIFVCGHRLLFSFKQFDYRAITDKYVYSFHINELINTSDSSLDSISTKEDYVLPQKVQEWLGNKSGVPLTLKTRFIINPMTLCPSEKPVDYLIVIHSSVTNFDRRQGVRDTFGQRKLFSDLTQRVVFLLGTKSNDAAAAIRLKYEAAVNEDIVQGDFKDSYHNLTLKGTMGLRWIAEFCPNAKLIVKIDDDVFLNVFRLVVHILPEFANRTHTIGCKGWKVGENVIRRQDIGFEKWPVDNDLFKGHHSYPFQHCMGFFVVMTGDLIQPLLDAARFTPFFWIDDVYLYGILPLVAEEVGLVEKSVGFEPMWREVSEEYFRGLQCMSNFANGYPQACIYTAVYSNSFTDKSFRALWDYVDKMPEKNKEQFHFLI